MSAAEHRGSTAVAPRSQGDVAPPRARSVSSRLLSSELRLIFGRRRNWIVLAVLGVVPVIIAVATKLTTSSSSDGGDFFAAITSNGLFVALAALTVEMGFFLPLAVSAISGDTVAGEANLGTLRYLLTVPVHRTRLLAVKYVSVVIFSFVATVTVSVVGVVSGLALFGGGRLTTLSGSQVSTGHGLWLVFLATAYLSVGFASLGAVGLFISTLTEQPIGATIAVVIVSILSFILDAIPKLEWLHPYLLTHWWTSFGDLLRDPIAWSGIQRGLLTAAAYTAVFLLAAWARFTDKDVTS